MMKGEFMNNPDGYINEWITCSLAEEPISAIRTRVVIFSTP